MPRLPVIYDALQVEREIEERIWPFVSRNTYAIASLPDASRYPFMYILLSNGTSNRNTAQSDATVWRYLDGTAV